MDSRHPVLHYLKQSENCGPRPFGSHMPVRFVDVWFGYAALGRDVLKGLSFDVPAGRMVALVGHPGAGKSSCAGLLMRLCDIEAGAIRIGSTDIREWPSEILCGLVALVPQDCSLHPERAMRDELQLGKPDARFEEIEEAARRAEVHEVILRLPQGYDTPHNIWNRQLTAGERQRIAMARLLLTDASIVILHETAARLNRVDETALQRALSQLRRGRTVLLISHRLSTIKLADSIVVIEDGVVVEEGTHDHLVAWNDRYARLIATQTVRD